MCVVFFFVEGVDFWLFVCVVCIGGVDFVVVMCGLFGVVVFDENECMVEVDVVFVIVVDIIGVGDSFIVGFFFEFVYGVGLE